MPPKRVTPEIPKKKCYMCNVPKPATGDYFTTKHGKLTDLCWHCRRESNNKSRAKMGR